MVAEHVPGSVATPLPQWGEGLLSTTLGRSLVSTVLGRTLYL